MSVSQVAPTLKEGLSDEEKKFYSQLFKQLDNEGLDIVTGEKARSTFEKTGLPPAVLGEIWQLADQNNTGFLTQYGFCVAMRLVGHVQSGKPLSPALADSVGPLPRFINMPLQAQSTNQSLNSFQSQPNAQHTPTSINASLHSAIPPVSQSDVLKFAQLFNRSAPSGELSGDQAKSIFLKAKLPTPVLGQIWALVDVNNTGQLNAKSFIVAMHLIQGLINGSIKQLPPVIPQALWDSISQSVQKGVHPSANVAPVQQQYTGNSSIRQTSVSSIGSNQTVRHQPEWSVTPQMKKQYDSIFDSIDTARTGLLQPDQVAGFLMKSNLGQEDLAAVWDLSDIQNTGIFTKLEFSIALYLINKKIQGGELPNVVPEVLINSIKSANQPQINNIRSPSQNVASLQQPPNQQYQHAPPVPTHQSAKVKSSLDDLVGIFGASSPSAPSVPVALARTSSGTSNSSAGMLPKVRKVPTGQNPPVTNNYAGSRFVPSSSFGQTLVKQHEEKPKSDDTPSLLGDDTESSGAASNDSKSRSGGFSQPPQTQQQQYIPQPQQQQQPPAQTKSVVNYEALRTVPPPPPVKKASTGFVQTPSESSFQTYTPPVAPSSQAQAAFNDDLLADSNPEISGKLSQATTDIANVSNQIKSLTAQTTTLQDKKGRAQSELSKILQLKAEIENKLNKLRTAYATEASQVQEVEDSLKKSREETENLRSEASISEAKYNQIQTDIQAKQSALETSQKENSLLKEKLGFMNAETVELESQLEKLDKENKSLKNSLVIKRSQVEVVRAKNDALGSNIRKLEQSNIETKAEFESAAFNVPHESTSSTVRGLVDEVKTKPSQDMTGIDDISNVSKPESSQQLFGFNGTEPPKYDAGNTGTVYPSNSQGTGSNPFFQSSQPTLFATGGQSQEATSYDLPQTSINNFAPSTITDQTVESTTNSETPSSSPPTSDFQYRNNNYGIVGGLPNVPNRIQRTDSLTSSVQNNAALSVRDDNLDELSEHGSHVSNENPVSATSNRYEPPTISAAATFDQSHEKNVDDAENDKVSSGVESFEMVNAEDTSDNLTAPIKDISKEAVHGSQGITASSVSAPSQAHSSDKGNTSDNLSGHTTIPGSFDDTIEGSNKSVRSAYSGKSSDHNQINEEFPPIKELDYEESSSSDESQVDNESVNDEFDDAFEKMPTDSAKSAPLRSASDFPGASDFSSPSGDFDKAFDNLTPAVQRSSQQKSSKSDDLFADEFDDLKLAEEEHDIPEHQADADFENNFESGSFYNEGAFSQPFSNTPQQDQFQFQEPAQPSANDEWEQLFAGFGNSSEEAPKPQVMANPSQEQQHFKGFSQMPAVPVANNDSFGGNQPAPPQAPRSTPHSVAIEELVGMGFEENVAIDALQKHNYDLEASTNYLLDHY